MHGLWTSTSYLKGLMIRRILLGKVFSWHGASDDFKYHMAKWATVNRPTDQGGLVVINTNTMNECLLVKWIRKLINVLMRLGLDCLR